MGVELDVHYLPFYVTRGNMVLLENNSSHDSDVLDQDLKTLLREYSRCFSVYELDDMEDL